MFGGFFIFPTGAKLIAQSVSPEFLNTTDSLFMSLCSRFGYNHCRRVTRLFHDRHSCRNIPR